MKLSAQQRTALAAIDKGRDVPAPVLRSLVRSKLVTQGGGLTEAGRTAIRK